MKFLTVLCASLAIICALPGGFASGIFYRADAPILTQYHSQGELGEYNYGYNAGLSGKVESRSIDGITRGSYSYLDSNGILQTVEYTADAANGFRAAATNLPRAPIDNAIAPEPVKDTPEVAQARAEHMAAYNKEATRTPIEGDSVEIMAAPIPAPIPASIPQIARIESLNGGFVALRAAEYPRSSFSYQFSSPAYAYTTGYPNAQYIAFDAPIIRASPIGIRPAVEIRTAPLELRTPLDTPEVMLARAEHLAAVEKEKARIAARN
ncbi:cuticle protein 19.8-like [Bradysia coprophila]|uniref:cuticle protein 19.8-like n=1 Tax=Bradysia coprophila TaxID=38358 RepID=UPI00187DD3F7|nr:cuticle protein 19.8-like [Bradysia coprophila]